MPAEHLGQRDPGLEVVEEPAVGQVQVDPDVDAEDLGRPPGLLQPDVGAGRERGRLAVGQVDDPDLVALAGEPGQRAAAGDLDVVGVGPDGDHVQLDLARLGHADPFTDSTVAPEGEHHPVE